jgi:hypothetical protein
MPVNEGSDDFHRPGFRHRWQWSNDVIVAVVHVYGAFPVFMVVAADAKAKRQVAGTPFCAIRP